MKIETKKLNKYYIKVVAKADNNLKASVFRAKDETTILQQSNVIKKKQIFVKIFANFLGQ